MIKYLDYSGLEHLVSRIKSESFGAVRRAGLIVPYAGATAPAGYLLCDGASYATADYPELYAAIGNTYGGDDTSFNVPDLRGRVPLGNSDTYALGAMGGEEAHKLTEGELPHLEGYANFRGWTWGGDSEGINVLDAGGIMSSTKVDSDYDQLLYGNDQGDYSSLEIVFGSDQPHNNMQPYLAISYIISTGKVANETETTTLNDLIAQQTELRAEFDSFKKGDIGGLKKAGLIFPYANETAPAGYLLCDGASYSVKDYPELYAAIGNIYGGDDDTFNVPDLRGRVPLGSDSTYVFGSQGGEVEHVLTADEMPSHTHSTGVYSDSGNPMDYGHLAEYCGKAGESTGWTTTTTYAGGDQAHNNMQPYLAINYIISTGKVASVAEDTTFNDLVVRQTELQSKLDMIEGGVEGKPRKAGLVMPFAGQVAPDGYLLCDGSSYAVADYPELFASIGTTYGGSGGSFNVPDLRGRVPLGSDSTYVFGSQGGEAEHVLTVDEMPSHAHDFTHPTMVWSTNVTDGVKMESTNQRWKASDNIGAGVTSVGGSQPHNNMQPYLAVNYIISTGRVSEASASTTVDDLVFKLQEIETKLREYMKGETSGTRKAGLIMPYASSVAPTGYLLCDGSSYDVADYPELFASIGTTYGGADGSFNVPDLRGRVPLGSDDTYAFGSTGGEEEHVLTVDEMPSHDHSLEGITNVTSEAIDGYLMTGGYTATKEYDGSPMPTGGDQPHNNMQPYLAINYIISTGKTVNLSDVLTPDDIASGPLPISEGGTGATTAAEALANLGITCGTEPAPAMGTPGSIYIQISEVDA